MTVSGNLGEGRSSVVTQHRSKAVKRESRIGMIKELTSQQMSQGSVEYFTSSVKGLRKARHGTLFQGGWQSERGETD